MESMSGGSKKFKNSGSGDWEAAAAMISLNVELDASPPGGKPSTKYLERHQTLNVVVTGV